MLKYIIQYFWVGSVCDGIKYLLVFFFEVWNIILLLTQTSPVEGRENINEHKLGIWPQQLSSALIDLKKEQKHKNSILKKLK